MNSTNLIVGGIVAVFASLLLLAVATVDGPFNPFTAAGLATIGVSTIGWALIAAGVIAKLVALGAREARSRTD